MSRNNDVFRVLVASGNAAVLAADSKPSDLAVGQLGVFDAKTNLAIDGTVQVNDFYIALGLDNGSGSLGDIYKSAGSLIQRRNIRTTDLKTPVASVPMVVNLVNYTANCNTEYGVKLELKNQEIFRTQGFNQFTKSFFIKTACCNGCTETCPSGDSNEITKLLKLAINNDPSGLLTAKAIARNTLTKATIDAVTTGVFSANIAIGAEVSDADLLVLMEYNSLTADTANWLYTDLQITTVTAAINSFASINLKYFYPRENFMSLSKIEGFDCNGSVVVAQAPVYEQGSGYDVQQLEFQAQGHSGVLSPYRLSTLNGVAKEGLAPMAVATTKYTQFVLAYDQFSVGAWLEYLSNIATIIEVPSTSTVTINSLKLVLTGLLFPDGIDTFGTVVPT